MNWKSHKKPSGHERSADPTPSSLPDSDGGRDTHHADLVEGDEGGGTSGLGNKERHRGRPRKLKLNKEAS